MTNIQITPWPFPGTSSLQPKLTRKPTNPTDWIDSAELSTPAYTDAETETETETDALSVSLSPTRPGLAQPLHVRKDSDSLVRIDSSSEVSKSVSEGGAMRPGHARHKSVSKHDLIARYFRKDVVGLKNIDLLRWVS
jgi:hypothetical protein